MAVETMSRESPDEWFVREVLPLEPMIVRFLRRNWRNEAEIDDLRQEAYVRIYESAMRETDHNTLFKRIEVAGAAILTRREVLMQSPDGFAERQEIKLALAKLRNLKKEVVKFL